MIHESPHGELFTVEELAERLKVPKSWIYERTRLNAIPFRRLGKYVRFSEKDIQEIMGAERKRPDVGE